MNTESRERRRLNVYTCQKCGGKINTIDRDEGVTPFMVGCRADDQCTGMMESCFYRCEQTIIATWEWYRPSAARVQREDPAMIDHFMNGGLILRRIDGTREDAGPFTLDDLKRDLGEAFVKQHARPNLSELRRPAERRSSIAAMLPMLAMMGLAASASPRERLELPTLEPIEPSVYQPRYRPQSDPSVPSKPRTRKRRDGAQGGKRR